MLVISKPSEGFTMDSSDSKEFAKMVDRIVKFVVDTETSTIRSASNRTFVQFALLPDLINSRLNDMRAAKTIEEAGRVTAEAHPVDAIMAAYDASRPWD